MCSSAHASRAQSSVKVAAWIRLACASTAAEGEAGAKDRSPLPGHMQEKHLKQMSRVPRLILLLLSVLSSGTVGLHMVDSN